MTQPMSVVSPYIVETSEPSFDRDVIERSRDVPVVVDFWAEWCGPCRTLGPILEKLAGEYGGQFILVKADTERVPGIAAEFGVRSIPAVFGLRDGQVVDSFVGALPEPAIRKFLDRLMPTPAETKIAEARKREATDPEAAESSYRDALALTPHDPRATLGLARVLLTGDRLDEARSLIGDLERRGFLEPEAERLKAELMLRGQVKQGGGLEAARAAAAAHPGDLALKLQLARALAAAGQFEEALETGLDLVERDRKGVGEEARKMMLNIFQLLPEDSELLSDYRRRLAATLF